jgi:hypothetical protein
MSLFDHGACLHSVVMDAIGNGGKSIFLNKIQNEV